MNGGWFVGASRSSSRERGTIGEGSGMAQARKCQRRARDGWRRKAPRVEGADRLFTSRTASATSAAFERARSGSIEHAIEGGDRGVKGAEDQLDAAEYNAPRSRVPPAEAVECAVKARSSPVSLSHRGAPSLSVPALTSHHGRAARNERSASEHEAQASGRAARRKSRPAPGARYARSARREVFGVQTSVRTHLPTWPATPVSTRERARGHAQS